MNNKEIMVKVYLLLNNGKMKAEYIRFNDEQFLSNVNIKTRDILDSKYKNYKILSVHVFELIFELKDLL